MPISTSNLAALPKPKALEKLTVSLAMLDAIMSPDWKYRYFRFDPAWDVAKSERLATLDTGSGDHYFLLLSPAGVFLKGFGHEAIMTPWAHDPLKVWPGVLDQVPAAFAEALKEPAFDMESTTFCIWRESGDDAWRHGDIDFPDGDADPDGSKDILWMLDGRPETYVQFCTEYYEKQVPVEAVAAIYSHTPLTQQLSESLNPEAKWSDVEVEARKLGYPVAELSKP